MDHHLHVHVLCFLGRNEGWTWESDRDQTSPLLACWWLDMLFPLQNQITKWLTEIFCKLTNLQREGVRSLLLIVTHGQISYAIDMFVQWKFNDWRLISGVFFRSIIYILQIMCRWTSTFMSLIFFLNTAGWWFQIFHFKWCPCSA